MTSEETRTARCGCGAFTLTARGAPVEVYACSCLDCQRISGSAFSYAALFPQSVVSIAGEYRVWRHSADSGRWIEHAFCPTCGVSVFSRAEALPDSLIVAAGCFADPRFPKPERVYWATRHHDWVRFPDSTEILSTQPGVPRARLPRPVPRSARARRPRGRRKDSR